MVYGVNGWSDTVSSILLTLGGVTSVLLIVAFFWILNNESYQ